MLIVFYALAVKWISVEIKLSRFVEGNKLYFYTATTSTYFDWNFVLQGTRKIAPFYSKVLNNELAKHDDGLLSF